jgi:hypothetical protein
MGIEIAWPIDPWLNLFVSPKVMQTWIATVLLGMLYWNRVSAAARRHVVLLGGCALLIALLLVYGLAVDPKPRMFMALVAACALSSGVFADAAIRNGIRLFPAFILGGGALYGLHVLSIFPTTHQAEAGAREWIARKPASIEIDDQARAFMALVPKARALPVRGSGQPMLITAAVGDCSALARPSSGPLAHVKLVDSAGAPNSEQLHLCLWSYPEKA